jgi:hypothetical protein
MTDLHCLDQAEHSPLRKRATSTDSAARHDPGLPALARLQAQFGNARVARLLAQRSTPDEEKDVQAKHEVVGAEGGPVGSTTASQIQSLRGSGAPLDGTTRSSMESAFGTSFGDVRVHTGTESDGLNRSLTARAFTTGNDIFLRGDASPTDSRLMAHELTHVVQQRSMASSTGGMGVGAANDPQEHQADAMADSIVQGGPVRRTTDDHPDQPAASE